MNKEIHAARHHTPLAWWYFWIALILIIMGVVGGAHALYASRYENRIFPGVTIGTVPVSGLTLEAAHEALTTRIDAMLNSPLVFEMNGRTFTIAPRILAPNDPDVTHDLISFDREEALQKAMRIGRDENIFKNILTQYHVRYRPVLIPMHVTLNTNEILSSLKTEITPYLTLHRDATFGISWNGETPTVTALPESAGTILDETKIVRDITSALSHLVSAQIAVIPIIDAPTVTTNDVLPLVTDAQGILIQGPWKLRYEKETWTVSSRELSTMVRVEKISDGAARITLGNTDLENLLDRIAQKINRESQDAKFKIEGTRVVEFQPSKDGIELDREATRAVLIALVMDVKKEGDVVATKSTPHITVRDVNNLGIEEMLGVGTSNFKGSPHNRIENIKNGARLLNGSLIKPDEEFSLLGALRPFTTDNGYLPELVIKGDKITPEIGGGLCQIGTTTFRATMNSGLPVTVRHNHSLVVSYYNDPSNKNPGTDATIYDPWPDFKFINDTGSYMLLATEVDLAHTELRFTLWGKPDGRKGYYSPPVVDRWLPVGPSVTTETTDLPIGKKECQPKHPGADAHFTYTIEHADGTHDDKLFTSHYRPLPEICLLGVEKKTDIPPTSAIELTPAESADIPVSN